MHFLVEFIILEDLSVHGSKYHAKVMDELLTLESVLKVDLILVGLSC